LTTILLAGLFVAISPSSFFVGETYAEIRPNYVMEMFDSKDPSTEYGGMDDNYGKSYEKDPYNKNDFKKKIVNSIDKFNCININTNINGGNRDLPTTTAADAEEQEERDLNANVFGSENNNGERYINDEYNKQVKDPSCLIKNNNNNVEPQDITGTLGTVRIQPGNEFDDAIEGISTATCNPDEQVIGGIYDYVGAPLVRVDETIDTTANSYSVNFRAQTGFEADFQASAVCISNEITLN
jgi:hypothetical protein